MATKKIEDMTLEEVIAQQKALKERQKALAPNPLSVNAKNNRVGIERHVTSVLQCVNVLVKEGAFDASSDFVKAQLARLSEENLVKNAMKAPTRSLRGRAATKAKAEAEAAEVNETEAPGTEEQTEG